MQCESCDVTSEIDLYVLYAGPWPREWLIEQRRVPRKNFLGHCYIQLSCYI